MNKPHAYTSKQSRITDFAPGHTVVCESSNSTA